LGGVARALFDPRDESLVSSGIRGRFAACFEITLFLLAVAEKRNHKNTVLQILNFLSELSKILSKKN
jgi:hypothetical protein